MAVVVVGPGIGVVLHVLRQRFRIEHVAPLAEALGELLGLPEERLRISIVSLIAKRGIPLLFSDPGEAVLLRSMEAVMVSAYRSSTFLPAACAWSAEICRIGSGRLTLIRGIRATLCDPAHSRAPRTWLGSCPWSAPTTPSSSAWAFGPGDYPDRLAQFPHALWHARHNPGAASSRQGAMVAIVRRIGPRRAVD